MSDLYYFLTTSVSYCMFANLPNTPSNFATHATIIFTNIQMGLRMLKDRSHDVFIFQLVL